MNWHDVFYALGVATSAVIVLAAVGFVAGLLLALLGYWDRRVAGRRWEREMRESRDRLFEEHRATLQRHMASIPDPYQAPTSHPRPWSEPAVKGFLRGDR